jgi:hypothetical protein
VTFQLTGPGNPLQTPQPVAAPVIYVTEPLCWEYRQLIRDANREGLLDNEALNDFGQEGWELAAALLHGSRAVYIFKRVLS